MDTHDINLMAIYPDQGAMLKFGDQPPIRTKSGETVNGWVVASISNSVVELERPDHTQKVQLLIQ